MASAGKITLDLEAHEMIRVAWAVVRPGQAVILHHIRSTWLVAAQLAARLERERGGTWVPIPVYTQGRKLGQENPLPTLGPS